MPLDARTSEKNQRSRKLGDWKKTGGNRGDMSLGRKKALQVGLH